MTPLRGSRTTPLRGTVTVPGDKSVSHRALMLAAMAPGRSSIEGLNPGDDVSRTAAALRALGATVLESSGRVEVEGWGPEGPGEPHDIIDAGNSGTTARVLLGILAGGRGAATVTGDDSLRRRPMLRIVAPLRSMGASIDGRAHGDRLPVTVLGGPLTGTAHNLSVASAQVKSALLLAGLRADGITSVTEPSPSRDHTERMLAAAGVEVTSAPGVVSVRGGQSPGALAWEVPGDISAAMFLIVAAIVCPGSELRIERVGLNPTRTGALDVLRAMGADLTAESAAAAAGDPIGSVSARASTLHGVRVTAAQVPTLIDEIPILAIAASQAEGTTVFESVGELRAKESDRIAAIVTGLEALGANASASEDDLVIEGGSKLSGGLVMSRDDHRIAMSFAVAGLVSSAPVRVEGWRCVETSFPGFLDVLGRAQGRMR